jgi:hypothetical protein
MNIEGAGSDHVTNKKVNKLKIQNFHLVLETAMAFNVNTVECGSNSKNAIALKRR